nr:universal stress protein [uncultured Roseateles sp.]
MYTAILVPLDGSRTALRGLREAMVVAQAMGSRVTLLHVLDTYPDFGAGHPDGRAGQELESRRASARDMLATAAMELQDRGLAVTMRIRESFDEHAASAIIQDATDHRVDLIAMGTHGRRGISKLVLGSDAALVLRDSPVPVLLVGPPPGEG